MTASRSKAAKVVLGASVYRPLCEEDMLDVQQVQEAIDFSRLELIYDVDIEKFVYWMNHIIQFTIQDQLTLSLAKQEVDGIRKRVRSYQDFAKSLSRSEFPPPMLSKESMDKIQNWLDAMERRQEKRRSGGAPDSVEQRSFMPKALGLFHAGFGETPDSSKSLLAKDQEGAAFRFILKVSETVSRVAAKRVKELPASIAIKDEVQSNLRWIRGTDDAIHKRLKSAIDITWNPDFGSAGENFWPIGEKLTELRASPKPAWQVYSLFFRPRILRD